jgi:hypothetical protein
LRRHYIRRALGLFPKAAATPCSQPLGFSPSASLRDKRPWSLCGLLDRVFTTKDNDTGAPRAGKEFNDATALTPAKEDATDTDHAKPVPGRTPVEAAVGCGLATAPSSLHVCCWSASSPHKTTTPSRIVS